MYSITLKREDFKNDAEFNKILFELDAERNINKINDINEVEISFEDFSIVLRVKQKDNKNNIESEI